MLSDVLGRTRDTLDNSRSIDLFVCKSIINLLCSNAWVILEICPCWGLMTGTVVMNEEFLVNIRHQRILIMSLPFVHTARRCYRLNDLVRCKELLL